MGVREKAKVSAILLAGGKSLRMGKDKAFLPFRGKAMFGHSLEVLKSLSNEVFISSANHVFRKIPEVQVVPDEVAGCGPMGGILSCLRLSSFEYSLVLSCDMPFVPAEYFRFLLDYAQPGKVITGRRSNGYVEPLAAVYSKELIPVLEGLIKLKKFRMTDIAEVSASRIINLSDSGFDEPSVFTNINSPEDFDLINITDEREDRS